MKTGTSKCRGHYFKNESLEKLLKEVSEFIAKNPTLELEKRTDHVSVEFDNETGFYIMSLYSNVIGEE